MTAGASAVALQARGNGPLYLLVAAASLVLSAWCAYATRVPNPDALLYLHAAQLMADGDWWAGVALYKWPFYSAIVGAVIAITGSEAFLAAQLVNAALTAATSLGLTALVDRLSHGNRTTVVGAAILVLFHSQLIELRPIVIRDHGFLTFFVLSLYLTARAAEDGGWRIKAALVLSIILCGLFRIEGFTLLLLVPAFAVFARQETAPGRLRVVVATALLSLLSVPVVLAWIGGVRLERLTAVLNFQLAEIAGRVSILKDELLRFNRSDGEVAFAGIAIAVTVRAIVRAVTLPTLFLAAIAYVPRRVVPKYAGAMVSWFGAWQVPILLLFAALQFFVDWRYAMALSLVLLVPAAFALGALLTGWRARRPIEQAGLATALLAVAVSFAVELPRPGRAERLLEAGDWLKEHVPPDAPLVVDDPRIAFFAGRFGAPATDVLAPHMADPRKEVLVRGAGFVAIAGRMPDAVLPLLPEAAVVARISDAEGTVTIYRRVATAPP